MSEEVRRVGRELVYKGAILEVYKDHMEFANGNHADWDYIHHDGAAAVVPVLPDGRILMVSQYRNALERHTLEIPAGKLDRPDEPGRLCAGRELEEETGVKDLPLEQFAAASQHLDEDEYVDVKAYAIEELKEMIFGGTIEDSKTIAAILAYESKYLKQK